AEEQPSGGAEGKERREFWVALLVIVLLAAVLRFAHMDYKEIQGDEGILLVRAAAMLTGDDAELFLHQKGPAEILIPMATWSLTGKITEYWGRLPFTWASLLSVMALFAVARRWLGDGGALATAALFAIMGFSVAFARIIQYQSLVLLWSLLALLTAVRYAETRTPREFYQAGWFLAAGLLAHYDTILFAPAVGLILLTADLKQRTFSWRLWLTGVGSALLLVALFYLPFALDENFGRTFSYLLNDRVGVGDDGTLAGGSGAAVWRMVTFYNSTYYIIGVAVLALVGLAGLRHKSGRDVLGLLAVLLVPLLFYTLIVTDPRTHVYTIFPGLLLLSGWGAAWLWEKVPVRIVIGTVGVVWFGVCAFYIVLLFSTAEIQRHWAEKRPSFYWTTWSEPPEYGLFGFPYQAGWRTAAAWLENRDGWYASNEEEEITNWYMAQAPRTHCPNFDTFVLAESVQDEMPYDPAWLSDWHVQAVVKVDKKSKMLIYGREQVAAPLVVDGDWQPRWLSYWEVAPPRSGGTYPVDVVLGEQVRLVGYDIDKTTAAPGETIELTLYWQSLRPFERNYQSFVHLYDGMMWGQSDQTPECGINPTTRWEPGQLITDPHVITIAADTPAGEIPLLVGMYDLLTVERLTNPADPRNVVELTTINIGR
ncbi:MAG: glycosyltransferase family 39 protein, partial [Anaerolineales bacterium]|nr:glycosyltransferase family 39 protein [Anaerolineales bacterium]